jgi:hypothetical protein
VDERGPALHRLAAALDGGVDDAGDGGVVGMAVEAACV